MNNSSELDGIVAFLRGLGIAVRFEPIVGATFLPGIAVCGDTIVIDPERLLYPGDLLHEAGHLALLPPAERAAGAIGDDQGLEMGAIAWSWAALRHLALDPAVVFHAEGYRGGSRALIENFTAGRYIGVPILQWLGMTTRKTFPAMTQWLRTESPPAEGNP